MTFDEVYHYTKNADAVFRMFTDKTYFERKYAGSTSSFEVLDHALDDKTFRIRVRRTMPADIPVPGFAKKLLPGEMTVEQEDVWDLQARTGRITIEIDGAPVQASAQMKLVDGDKGGENHVHWTVQCSVPLIGNKVAKFVASDIQAKSPADVQLSNQILADY